MPLPLAAPETALRISEIFWSIQGESTRVGLPTVFVRLTGCPLRCRWCDTAHAFDGGERLDLNQVIDRVGAFAPRCVCVTGGEPLAQKPCLPLLSALCDAGFAVSLETSGALDIAGVDRRVAVVMDLKAPGSGEEEKNRWANLSHLKPGDEIKLVLADEADYRWAKALLAGDRLAGPQEILMSPVHGRLNPAQLADWILRDGLQVRLQVPLHKTLWGEARGR